MLAGESNSITNQKAMLMKYAEDNNFTNVEFYIDDGFSGTTFDRPDFIRLTQDMRSGKIGTVITKDLSRLGRDYIMTGQYIEMIFPENNVRYIAVNDNVDTDGFVDDLIVFRNVFNDFYAKDTSKKIRSVFKLKGMSGKPLATVPPYGYKKSDNDRNVWEIDEDAAAVVRRIYRMCIEGYGTSQIAKALSRDKILIPAAYAESKSKLPGTYRYNSPTYWNDRTIMRILDMAEYAGHTVNFKTCRKSYKCRKKIMLPPEQWVVFRNTHEAIIAQEVFDKVQMIREQRRRINKMPGRDPLTGIAFCADCGRVMYVTRARSGTPETEHLTCSGYSKDTSLCGQHYLRTCVLNNVVLEETASILRLAKKNPDMFRKSVIEKNKKTDDNKIDNALTLLEIYRKRIDEIDSLNIRLYEDNAFGRISDERYLMLSAAYDSEQERIYSEIRRLDDITADLRQRSDALDSLMGLAKLYDRKSFDISLAISLVRKMIVHSPDKSSGHRKQLVEIFYKHLSEPVKIVIDSRKYRQN